MQLPPNEGPAASAEGDALAPWVEWASWIREALGEGAVLDVQGPVPKDGPREAFLRVPAPRIAEVLRFLRDDPRLRFDFLANLTALDWPARAVFEIVYHLVSYPHRLELTLRCEVPRAAPALPSAVSLYPVADWQEREQYDLLGVVFEGHPDLRRLLMPDDWQGFPLRKDYVEGKFYRGMPTSRPSPMDLLLHYDREHAHAREHAPRPAAPTTGQAPPVAPREKDESP